MTTAAHAVTADPNRTTPYLGLFGRADLFASRQAYGWGSCPCTIWLHADLDEHQRAEALRIVEGAFPVMGYGWRVDGKKIDVWSCE